MYKIHKKLSNSVSLRRSKKYNLLYIKEYVLSIYLSKFLKIYEFAQNEKKRVVKNVQQ